MLNLKEILGMYTENQINCRYIICWVLQYIILPTYISAVL